MREEGWDFESLKPVWAGKGHAMAEADLPVPTCVLKCREPGNPFGPEQTFYVLGTAHVSSASCQDVEKLIRAVQPQVLCAWFIPGILRSSALRNGFCHADIVMQCIADCHAGAVSRAAADAVLEQG